MSKFGKIAEGVLEDFSLEEILEMNDLLDEDVLELLIEEGLIDLEYLRPETSETQEEE